MLQEDIFNKYLCQDRESNDVRSLASIESVDPIYDYRWFDYRMGLSNGLKNDR